MEKTVWIALFTLFAVQLSLGQTSERYPLHVGNLWQYARWGGAFPERVSRQVVGDTVMPNGRTYRVVREGDAYGNWFAYHRTSGDSVYQYQQQDELLYDFSRQEGDTVAVIPRTFDTTVIVLFDTGIVTWCGQSHRVRWDFFIDNLIHGVDDEVSHEVVDSVGIIGWSGFGFWVQFQGAIINGEQCGSIVLVQDPKSCSPSYGLRQNYPNPFNPTTAIAYEVPESRFVTLRVFDLLGKEVSILVNEFKYPGTHTVPWNATAMPSGVYFYRLQAGDFVATKKAILLK